MDKMITESDKTTKYCFLCQIPCTNVCPHCRLVHYCNDEHFKLHRVTLNEEKDDFTNAKEKGYCFPYEAKYKKGIGRILVATRNIKAMELIMVDPGTVVGPNYSSKPICIECLKPVANDNTCMGCEYPICSDFCASKHSNHTTQECEILSRCPEMDRPEILRINKDRTKVSHAYSIITPLRMLLLQQSDNDAWKRSDQLIDHILERKEHKAEWEWYEQNIVKYFDNHLQLKKIFSSKQIHRAIGLINVNAVALQYPKTVNSKNGVTTCSAPPVPLSEQPEGKGLYPIFAIMSHYCICNARYTLNPTTLAMYVRARSNIKKGEEISVQYLSALSGNFKRRQKIRDEWYFDCMCRRCSDPTECGSFVSALKCDICYTGVVLPADPLQYDSIWTCSRCGSRKEKSVVISIVDSLEEELDEISSSGQFSKFLDFIKAYSDTILHPHHYLIMTATRNLIQYYTYRSPNEFLESKMLSNKFELCKKFDAILGKIDPGYSEIRTFVQKELHFTRLLLCQEELEDGEIGREEYLSKTRQSMYTLQEIEKRKKQLLNFNCG